MGSGVKMKFFHTGKFFIMFCVNPLNDSKFNSKYVANSQDESEIATLSGLGGNFDFSIIPAPLRNVLHKESFINPAFLLIYTAIKNE